MRPRRQVRVQPPESRPTPRTSHNTEWQWNLGGSSSTSSSARRQQAQQASSANVASGSGSEFRWNLGGPSQPPQQGPGSRQVNRQAEADRQNQPLSRESSRESGVSQRPWQRRRVQAEASETQPPVEAVNNIDQADRNSQQGWRRLVPRFLRRGDSGQAGGTAAVPREGAQDASVGQPDGAQPEAPTATTGAATF